MLVSRIAVLSTTPFGCAGRPDEYWTNAMSSGRRDAQCRGSEVRDCVDEDAAPLEPSEVRFESVLARAATLRRRLERATFGCDVRIAQSGEHAEELALVLVGVSRRKGHRDDAAQDARPERHRRTARARRSA